MNLTKLLLLLFHVTWIHCLDWSSLKLVKSHVPYVFNHYPNIREACLGDSRCPYKDVLNDKDACWGFEANCKKPFGGSHPTLDCANEQSRNKYWKQADFGYLSDRLTEMKSRNLCKATDSKMSFLRCTREATMCKTRNLFLDLRHLQERVVRNNKVALQSGEIGGYCDLDQSALDAETAVKRDLSTWGEQLSPYSELPFDPFENTDENCDIVMDKPVVFVQLDFGGNMYHHFCDFFNLYLTQMANNSWFGTDVQVIRWDYSMRYGELFGSSWNVFTDHPHKSLYDYAWKRVCIPEATFAFLPRMAFGLFYSTPLEDHCRGSSLFRAFSQHFLYRMGITDELNVPTSLPADDPVRIRVTILDRGHSKNYKIFRRILNQDELVDAIKTISDIDVQLVKYSGKMAFEDQLRITHNSDIFIGMHGAGLAHFMFLPDWAVAFELYNCGDIRCYRDLPRLRGLRYLTWEDSSKLKEHNKDEHENYGHYAKFWNFSFDVDEFIRLVKKARSWLLEHPRFAHLRSDREEL